MTTKFALIDEGRVTYTGLRKRQHWFTVKATTADGESVNKTFTFFAKYRKNSVYIYNINFNVHFRLPLLSCVYVWWYNCH